MTERGSVSVSSSTSRIVYAGNNSLVTAYAVPFYFEENAHLNAIAKTAAGVETVVTLTNHTGAGNENGGTVRTAVAVPATSTLTIYREVPFTQATSYEENDAFPAASHERALDKLTTITQQLERRITNCIRGTEATPLSPIPSPTGTQQFVLSAASNQPPSWQELPVLAAGPVVATGSTQARFISDRFADIVNVKDFGAIGDAVTDDTAAFTAALLAPSAVVLIPAGSYYIPNPSAIAASTAKLWLAANAFFKTSVGGTLLPFSGVFYGEILPRDFGPIAIANDNSQTAAGQNAGLKVITGKFPTATPGLHDRVAATFGADNIDKTTAGGGIWGINVFALQAATNSDLSPATDQMTRAAEFEVAKVLGGAQPDPWSGSAPYRANGIEIVAHSASVYQPTAALTTWANDATGIKWWQVGAAISRVTKWGILFKKNPSGTTDTGAAFGGGIAVGAAIRDESDSTSVLSASGSHVDFLNIVDCASLGTFARLPSGFGYNAMFRNFSDYSCRIGIDSGNASAQQAGFILGDRGSFKWELVKLSNNKLSLFSYDTSLSAVIFETTSGSTVDSVFSTRIMPGADNTYDLGSAAREWKDLYIQNTATISDAREKINIADSDLGMEFVRSLRPVKYKMAVSEKVVTSIDPNGVPIATESRAGTRYHYGLLAQEVRDAIPVGGDFAGWVLSDKSNPQSRQSLRYHQFIAPIIKALQQIDARVSSLESK